MIRFYTPAQRPADEDARQDAVDQSGLLEARGDPVLEGIVAEAACLFRAPIAAISIVDRDRQYFAIRHGLDADETPRAVSFCAHAMLDAGNGLVVDDATRDARFAGNPLVTDGLKLRFYAGAPIFARDGRPLGALCVIDTIARETTPADFAALRSLADEISAIGKA